MNTAEPTIEDIGKIKAGIAPYAEEITRLRLFLTDRKSEKEFDREFSWEFPMGTFRKAGIPGAATLLGVSGRYGDWSWWLDLMQHLIVTGDVEQVKLDGVFYYRWTGGTES